MIEIRGLTKKFGGYTAVDNLSFSVKPGEVLGFLGPNGAGKSTTMKMLTGFLAPTAGTATVAGYDVRKQAQQVKQRIGYLPEGAPAYGEMTTKEFLRFIAKVRGIPRSKRKQAIDRVIDLINLDQVLNRPIDNLSKGYRRRVGIAQAIIHDPDILIMDEPTDGLDPNQKHEVRKLIAGMAENKIIIVSTHILEEVEAVCSRAVIIAQGKKLADGAPAELMAQSTRHGLIHLRTDSAIATESLAGLASVNAIDMTTDDNIHHLTITANNSNDALSDVAAMCSNAKWNIIELRQEQGRLDDLFRQITNSPEGAA